MAKDWIVRLKRRTDGRKYYFRHDCCTTARKESSMLMDEAVAKQLAEAIARGHPYLTAWATPYAAKSKKKLRQHMRDARAAAIAADSMRLSDTKVSFTLVETKKKEETSDTGKAK